ncbi:ABC transporter permease [Paenibacillus cremeus]|uniref:Sugar ABC transporter permease n=1 Tax=Paenibacillus cremeus TaxID=2163881 RepID=A0A559K6F8_9BACL|nr:ABC transporter permease subunit [Paenibacillus cremeus]TVY07725.1 sugar ABC transporter permease [Paenibacillus cremeus]
MNAPSAPAADVPAASLVRQHPLRKLARKYMYHYVLLLPGIIYFFIFKYVPMGGVLIAFKDYKLAKGILASDWVGIKWFAQLFADSGFWNSFENTILISFYKLIFGFPAPIIMAILLNEIFNSTFKRIIQTIIYFPHFLSWVVLGGVLFTFLSPSSGFLSLIGLSTSPLTTPDQFRSLLVISGIWKEAGWGTIIYLAAIAGINPELFEAARIDGASRFHLMRHITLPSIFGTIVVLLILRTGQILSAGFDQIFILYNPVVYNVGDIIDTYVYRVGLTMGRFSFATAAGLFQSVAGLALLLFSNWLSKRFTDQALW